VTAAHIKFLLLHDGRNEEAIKGFFRDVYEAYLRVRATCSGSFRAVHLHHAYMRLQVWMCPAQRRCVLTR
jgi:Sedlin, N-terminal conserved region